MGSAVMIYEYQSPEIDNCIFSNNISIYDGGAVGSIGGRPRFTNCVFSNNQAVRGGAMASLGESIVEIEDCVFFENTADKGGAIYFDRTGDATMLGSTFAWNHASEGANICVVASETDTLVVDQCIIAYGTQSEGVFWDGFGILNFSCVDIFGNTGGDWVGLIADQEMIMGNLHMDPQFCGDNNPLMPLSLAASSPCSPKNHPDCGLIGAYPVGCGQTSGAGDPPPMVFDFRLDPCYPNPFNPTTTISFELKNPAEVFLAVYDARGELVRTLESRFYPAGTNSTVWQGKNNHGRAVSSGVYFARLTIGPRSEVQKMILLR
jgi:predicted outer membrane repeat protein